MDINATYKSGQIIAASAEVTPSLVRESPNNALNSGLGIIVIWPNKWVTGVISPSYKCSYSLPYLQLVGGPP